MVNIVVIGHGAYARGVKENLEMISGVPDYMHFLDLTKDESLSEFEEKLNEIVESIGENQIIFACDLMGASPFRTAAMISAEKPEQYCTVSGLNAMAYMELAMDNSGELQYIADNAVIITKESVSKFIL